jgi:hypothetical protein
LVYAHRQELYLSAFPKTTSRGETMINIGKWRWLINLTLPLVVGAGLLGAKVVRFNFQGQAYLAYTGKSDQLNDELKMFGDHAIQNVQVEKVPGNPRRLSIRVDGSWPREARDLALSAAQACVSRSYDEKKKRLENVRNQFLTMKSDLEAPSQKLLEDRNKLFAGLQPNTSRARVVAQIAELKTRRQLLIANYPSHTDIPVLARKIHTLLAQLDRPSSRKAERIFDLDRQMNENKLRMDYFGRRAKLADIALNELKPSWIIVQPVQNPVWPRRVENWPLGAGVVLGLFALCMIMFRGREVHKETAANGLARPQKDVTFEMADFLRNTSEEKSNPETTTSPTGADNAVPPVSDSPVALEVLSPNLPADAQTEKAAGLYKKWVEVARSLYTPAPEPPQGVLDQVAPLLQESSEFLPQGHDVMARYLARSVTPGDLAAHVARTVLMTLTGAQEAGVSPEHRLAMALAALFHDLAVVPRPVPVQDEVGSEVGRLSASVLRRIPGLQPALLSMVEDILIGMDEFKLETWQNVANGNNLEPLSKVLREIDRFEKVMQKQKARLDRRVANQ